MDPKFFTYGYSDHYSPTKNSCVTCIGTTFSIISLIFQAILLLVIGVSISHQTLVLFPAFAWGLMITHAGFSLILSFVLVCGYHFDYQTWLRFKSLLCLALICEFITHFGVPMIFYLLTNYSTEEHDKAYFESCLLIFGLIAIIDAIILSGAMVPYYFLYENNQGFFKIQPEVAVKNTPQRQYVSYYQ